MITDLLGLRGRRLMGFVLRPKSLGIVDGTVFEFFFIIRVGILSVRVFSH